MTSPNRPPSCDLLTEDKQPKLKECPMCGSQSVELWKCEEHWVHCIECESCSEPISEHETDAPRQAIDKWNSIPRRSEVAELLRLVESTQHGTDWLKNSDTLIAYADKLRKEWGLP